jgi:hypothetical protein
MSGIRLWPLSFPQPEIDEYSPGSEWAGYGRKLVLLSGSPDFKSICEARLLQQSEGPRLGQVGTDAPQSNLVHIDVDPINVNLTIQVSYGSGSGSDYFYLSAATGTSFVIPATYWRIDARVEQVDLGAGPYPPVGTEVQVTATVGQGNGPHQTRPELTVYQSVLNGTTGKIKIPKRCNEILVHTDPAANLPATTIDQYGLGPLTAPNRIATWGPGITQDFVVPVFSGACEMRATNGAGAPSRMIWLFRLT